MKCRRAATPLQRNYCLGQRSQDINMGLTTSAR